MVLPWNKSNKGLPCISISWLAASRESSLIQQFKMPSYSHDAYFIISTHDFLLWFPILSFNFHDVSQKKKNFFFAASPSPSIWLEFLIDVIGFDWRSLSRWEISKHHLDAFGKEEGEAMSTCDVIKVRGR